MSSSHRTLRRWLTRIALGLLILLLLLAMSLWLFLRGSLARLDGEVAADGLAAPVSIARDARGVPLIAGRQRLDVAYATGYLHAQERFFQMDLLRRVAAGELAELVGAAALELDRDHRLHRFRARAEATLATLPAAERQLLARYAAGVNDGLAALSARPFEYGLLRQPPRPWREADSLLAIWAMYFDLQGNLQERELARGWLAGHASAEQLAVLLPEASAYDAPLDADSVSYAPPPWPAAAPAWFGRPEPDRRAAAFDRHDAVGSNNWALAGSRSAHGAALVANDMHLGLRLPNTWFHAALAFDGADGRPRRVAGVMLPGAPVIVAGSNGQVAWGFTNSYGDYLDLVELERDARDPRRFRTAAGWETARSTVERIAVHGAEPVELTVLETSLGPLRRVGGRVYAVHWVAHMPGAVNLGLAAMEDAGDLAAAQAVANRAGMPGQNMLAGDRAGRIGWTIAGPLPSRSAGWAQTFPYPAEQAARLGWQALRPAADYPRLLDPAAGQLATANARQLAGADAAKLGDGGFDLGARVRQIRGDLAALGQARPDGKSDERALHDVGLDDRALFMAAWRDRALAALDEAAVAGRPARAEFRHLLREGWTGHAGVDAVGYRLARGFLDGLYVESFGQLDAQLETAVQADFAQANPRWPVLLARLLDERPAGWLTGHADWRALQLAAIDRAIAEATRDGQPLAAASWGQRNTADIAHPFARLLPPLRRWLAAPADALAGDRHMPRVAASGFGQSERMVVAPGHEEAGILSMPGGQSGHPLSPYFLAGHAQWVRGEPVPFLPGPAVHTLRLVPR
ncbi:penicillin acylase family protein [Chitinimonas koreensis]|uniref:penicillin acylase family protein n=1 Tax=Chitinimonas koreensis TaxID=356302 RepID=UPI000407514B|nr:penicillin acylase family protein [Chitinimonas koreensis]QNM97964.1 penicillin acylase family protein [Chitinimonas koreensis]